MFKACACKTPLDWNVVLSIPHWIISFFLSSPQRCPPSSPFSCVILPVSARLHLQDAVISLAWLDVYCEAEIENGL